MDSDDEGSVTDFSTIKKTDIRQKPLRDTWRATSSKDTVRQTPLFAKSGRRSKTPVKNAIETESSDAENGAEQTYTDRKRLEKPADSHKTGKGPVLKSNTKASTAHLRKVNGHGHTSSATESQSSESEDRKTSKQNHIQTKSKLESRNLEFVSSEPANTAQKSHQENISDPSEEDASGSGTEQDSGSETSSESGREEASRSEESDQSASQTRSKPSQQVIIEPPLLPYTPPASFEAATIRDHPSHKQSELLSPLSLQTKQIWHITAPASVPISSIREVRKQSVTDGSVIMSYKDVEYGLVGNNEETHESLLLPSTEENSYTRSSIGITRTLRLQQVIHPGSKGSLSNAADLVRATYTKPIPKQPEGLKMRYKPFGASESEDSDSGSLPEVTSQALHFRIPQGLRAVSPVKKRKRENPDVEDGRSRDQSPKKARKGAIHTTSSINGIAPSPVKNPSKKHKSSRTDNNARSDHRHSSTIALKARSDYDREPSLTEASPLKPQSETPRKRTETIPSVDVERGSSINGIPEMVSSKHKGKSKRKRQDSHSVPELDDRVPRKQSSSLNTRTDHDRDAIVGAQSAQNGMVRDRLDRREPSPHKKSKHRDETPEEKAKRRAEKRRRKEMKAKGLING